ncbi:LURP-one-related/scramblase family protein [Acetivibrio cellulolyticus]|uniref:hypothetical protein n=1 Tax=Acetivibrio cellulolyticus TaxID=35830 RepID=UPI0001E2C204|nr:hypothetical protein [Acetivibrio cellulolyticus]
MDERFSYNTYLVRRKILKLVGGAFHFYDPMGNVVLYANMKAFKLKEDITIYSGEDMQEAMLSIKARNIVDFSATYDVFDAQSNEKIGGLRRKGLKSILKDEWLVLDESDNQIGVIKEDSTALALVRRFLTTLIPQTYSCVINNREVCEYKQNFNPFVVKVNVDFSMDREQIYDRRLGLAAGLLLCAIEGKQS